MAGTPRSPLLAMFQNLLIRRKLTLIMMVTSFVTLSVAFAAWLSYDSVIYKKSLVQNLDLISEMLGANSASAIVDQHDVRRTLKLLSKQRRIRRAVLFDAEGRPLATHPDTRDAETGQPPIAYQHAGHHFQGDSVLVVYRPIYSDGQELGTIALETDLSSVRTRLGKFAEIFALVLLVAMLVAFVISYKLQEVISQPILQLADTMRAVSDRKDYSLRSKRFGRDEVGYLSDALNEMLQRSRTATRSWNSTAARWRTRSRSALGS